jgi:O-antigen/teichoic acid export membrane protein
MSDPGSDRATEQALWEAADVPGRSRVLRNLFAGAVGRMLVAIIGVICVPLTVRMLGVERYGIISMSATFLSLSSLLDLGIAPSLNRELARLAALEGQAQRMRDLVRTLEVVAWAISAGIATLAVTASSYVEGWFRTTEVPVDDIRSAVALMGLAVAAQWPVSLYSGGLNGLQEQVTMNTVNVCAMALRSFGAVLVIWLVSCSMQAYLAWQIAIVIGQTAMLAFFLRRRLPAAGPPRIRFGLLREVAGLALGMSGTTALMVLTSQSDKLLLSRILPLESFGWYMIAWAIAFRLGMLTDPVIDSVYPHLTAVFSRGGADAVREPYRHGMQLMALATLPIALTVAICADDISYFWTIGAPYADRVATLMAPLTLGVAFVSLIDVPMVLQWSAGRARPVFLAKLAGFFLLVPGVALGSLFLGVEVGVWAWPAANATVLVATLPVVHRTVFGRGQKWWWPEVLGAALVIAASLVLWRLVTFDLTSPALRFVRLGGASALAAAVGVVSVPAGRTIALRLLAPLLRRARGSDELAL